MTTTPRTTMRVAAACAAAVIASPILAACGSSDDPEPDQPAASAPPSAAPAATASEKYAAAMSDPVEDSVYPQRGDQRIDTVHHDLDLTWKPNRRLLTGRQQITFRAAHNAKRFVLDLSANLDVRTARLDGDAVKVRHRGDVLTVRHAVERGDVHELSLSYAGTPAPAEAPTTRSDFDTVGFTIESDNRAWTMQEPFGAFTWYAVNDQPADKAIYSVRLSVPKPWVGISNGRMTSRTTAGKMTVTEFKLKQPVSSYLMTVAFGPYEKTKAGKVKGMPVTFWTPPDRPDLVERLDVSREGLRWLQKRLGPYPFDTLGFLIVPGASGMETQTMITLSDTTPSTAPETIVHELAHHWWGDQVGPCDWRDLWMNEGMAMYLQTLWTDDSEGLSHGSTLASWAQNNNVARQEDGPPGKYHPESFASTNVYVPPASIWHALRERLGDKLFWQLVRRWPAANDDTCATRQHLIKWWSNKSGEDLSGFFRSWLMSPTDPE